MNEEKKKLIYKKKRVLCWAKMIDNFFFLLIKPMFYIIHINYIYGEYIRSFFVSSPEQQQQKKNYLKSKKNV